MNEKKSHNGFLKLILMILISLAAQVVALMKSSIIASKFGASAEMDAFNFANSTANFVFSFLISGISTIVIPCYVKKTKKKITDSFLTIIFLGTLFIVFLMLLLRQPYVAIVTGRDARFVSMAQTMLTILLLSNLATFFTSVTAAFFQYIEKYNLPKIISLFTQSLTVFALVLIKDLTVPQYALIIGLGLIVNSVLDLVLAAKNGWSYRPSLAVKEPETRELLITFLPVLASTGVYQFSLMIDTAIASRLNTGDVTILNFANQITSMVNTLLVGNILIYFYPKLVKDIVQKKPQKLFWDKTYFFHAIIGLIIVGYAAVGQEGLLLLFRHGKFSEESTKTVYLLGLLYIAAMQANIVRDMVYRYFYALADTKSTTENSIVATAVNIFFSLLLVSQIGLYGIVAGTAISSFVSLTTIMVRFGKRYGYEVPVRKILSQYLKTFLVGFVSLVIVLYSKRLLPMESNFGALILFGVESVLVYAVLTLLLNRKIVKIAAQI